MVSDLIAGIPLWRSPYLHYNVGAAPNRVSSAMYALATDLNIFSINDGLSGNAVIAEHAVVKILANLAGVDPRTSSGLFTFGGTGTNLYAVKLALSKTFPKSRKAGLMEKIKIVITEDSHFSHLNVLNWLGVGVDNTIVVKANYDRTSCIIDARSKIESALKDGFKIPAFIINGGTTYDNVIDDIKGFVRMRDELVLQYNLNYTPHIHVDSVIGWSWLFFQDYDFDENCHAIEQKVLLGIEHYYNRIKHVRLADSWGVDFHKGVGTCPVPSSVFMINDKKTMSFLSHKDAMDTHQLASEFSTFSPVDFTLETSRPAAAPLAAVSALRALGKEGYQIHLANLIQQNHFFRELIKANNRKDIFIINDTSKGYATMLQMCSPKLSKKIGLNSYIPEQLNREDLKEINAYTNAFFNYDITNRIKKTEGVEYSYSSGYLTTTEGVRVGALKFYPTSPYLDYSHILDIVETLCKQKDSFDSLQEAT